MKPNHRPGRYTTLSFLVSPHRFKILDSANLHVNLVLLENLVFPEKNTEDSHTSAVLVESTLY